MWMIITSFMLHLATSAFWRTSIKKMNCTLRAISCLFLHFFSLEGKSHKATKHEKKENLVGHAFALTWCHHFHTKERRSHPSHPPKGLLCTYFTHHLCTDQGWGSWVDGGGVSCAGLCPWETVHALIQHIDPSSSIILKTHTHRPEYRNRLISSLLSSHLHSSLPIHKYVTCLMHVGDLDRHPREPF